MTRGQVKVEGLGKRFVRRSPDRPETLQQWLLRGWRQPRAKGRFWALRDISFTIEPGEMVGVIGRNGSGKSTLLRLLGGVMLPDEGSVIVDGRISGLLELNTGMHPDLSGRENVIINGVLAGLTRRELIARMDDIITFAELENAIDSPVRTYSSGMKLRLGFAVAAHVRPDVLLIDEILSVGDLAFQTKCLDRIAAIKESGCSIILITHDLSQVEDLCDRAIWLDTGTILDMGTPPKVVNEYRTRETHRRTDRSQAARLTAQGLQLVPFENRFGTFEARIEDVQLCQPSSNSPANTITRGGPLTCTITLDASARPADASGHSQREPGPPDMDAADGPIQISVTIEDAGFRKLLDITSEADGVTLPPLTRLPCVSLTIRSVDLPPGDYRLSVGMFKGDWEHALDYHWRAYPLTVLPSPDKSEPRANIWEVGQASAEKDAETAIARAS